jgi:LacI family transcriptional regulator
MKIRIKDVARMANVSVGTVDRVIHKRGEVSEDSYKKVMAILDKTGYKPNLIARTLSAARSLKLIALIPNPSQDEYWKMSYDGIKASEETWAQYGISIVISTFDLYNKTSFRKAATSVAKAKPDGILVAPIFHKEAVDAFRLFDKNKIPFTLFNNNIEDSNALCFIGQNLYQSGMVGAELLQINQKQAGTYAILHIYDDISRSTHLYEKEKGFKDYFAQLPAQKNKVISLDLNVSHESTLKKELKHLLDNTSLRGLLVTTSKGASIVSNLLEKHGKNGVRMVAYDLLQKNIQYLNKGIIDFLINQNSRRQASMGISQLANMLVFQKQPPADYLFPLEIITRQNLESYLSVKENQ